MKKIRSEDFHNWIDHLIRWMCTTESASGAELARQTGMSQPTLSNHRTAYRREGVTFSCRIPMLKNIAAAHDKIERQAHLKSMKNRPKKAAPIPQPEPEVIPTNERKTRRRRHRRSSLARRDAS